MAHRLLGKRAREWVEKIQRDFSREIQDSIDGTKIYDGRLNLDGSSQPEILLSPTDSTTAIFEYKEPNRKIAVLNFANFIAPGGGFLGGSSAQEEMLCHESYLYNVISEFPDFYLENSKHYRGGLASDRGLYSPEIFFIDEERKISCDVITVAAPHLQHGIDLAQNSEALQSRIEFVRDIAEDQGVEILILGAFGCGAFHQNPAEASRYFREAFENRCESVKKIIYAIPPGDNFDAFKQTFSDAEVDTREFKPRYFLRVRQQIFKGEFDNVKRPFSILKVERAREHHSITSEKFSAEIQN